jgi:hypothetical protein
LLGGCGLALSSARADAASAAAMTETKPHSISTSLDCAITSLIGIYRYSRVAGGPSNEFHHLLSGLRSPHGRRRAQHAGQINHSLRFERCIEITGLSSGTFPARNHGRMCIAASIRRRQSWHVRDVIRRTDAGRCIDVTFSAAVHAGAQYGRHVQRLGTLCAQ